MPKKILKIQPITIPEVKVILESLGEENLDQFQRRSLDYATKMSRLDPESAKKLMEELMSDGTLSEDEAVQIVNIMPKSIEELRVFLAGGRKIIETSKLERILELLDKYRMK
ncbi:MAG: RNA polymerase Rpb4 family protein [Candidatus Bathyarchaeia archaeon]|nr:RNA polymerase Rpb4 [Candidatus Bathyarchaeota archaeon]